MKPWKPPTVHTMEKANTLIAHGALTNSKRAECFVKGMYPTHLKRGFGCRVVDVDDKEYIDFICGLGSNLLGYAQDEITQAITAQAKLGATLSLGTELEIRVAEKVREFFPFIERMRFLKTGSDACSAALRIARAYTRKDRVFSYGYHGWHDDFVSLTPPARGVPSRKFIQNAEVQAFNTGDIAALIIEPVITDHSEANTEHLRHLRDLCTKNGIVLIFDEVITGFRYPQYCVAKETGVYPDLICLGKTMGGGLPLSLVGGRQDIMETDYFVSSTFAGDTISLAAGLRFMNLLTEGNFKIEYLWQRGKEFLEKFNKLAPDIVTLEGYPTRSKLCGEPLNKAKFMQECSRAGILVGPSFFFIFPHIEITDQVLSIFSDILTRIGMGEVELEGEMPVQPYAEKVRQ